MMIFSAANTTGRVLLAVISLVALASAGGAGAVSPLSFFYYSGSLPVAPTRVNDGCGVGSRVQLLPRLDGRSRIWPLRRLAPSSGLFLWLHSRLPSPCSDGFSRRDHSVTPLPLSWGFLFKDFLSIRPTCLSERFVCECASDKK